MLEQMHGESILIDFRHCLYSPYIGYRLKFSENIGQILDDLYNGKFKKLDSNDMYEKEDYNIPSSYNTLLKRKILEDKNIDLVYRSEIEKILINELYPSLNLVKFGNEEVKNYSTIVTYRNKIIKDCKDKNVHILSNGAKLDIDTYIDNNISIVKPYKFLISG